MIRSHSPTAMIDAQGGVDSDISNSAAASGGDIDYALRWRVQGIHPGSHRGTGSADMGVFRGLVPFERSPDMRRLDLRRSMRDPFGQLYVRQYQPRLAVAVYVVVDVSASMAAGGEKGKMAMAARLCSLLARAAHRIGDSFGLYACGREVHEEISFAASRNRAGVTAMLDRLKRTEPSDNSASGLMAAVPYLAGPRKLVFLISDFLFPLEDVDQTLGLFVQHDVIPVVLEDKAIAGLPDWGIADFADMESGQCRFVLLRPSLKRRWLEMAAQRQEGMNEICRQHGNLPFRIQDRIDTEALNAYLLGR